MGKKWGRSYAFSSCVFDTQAGELLRGGKRVRISDQAARLLVLLLENRGAVVSRDEVKAELWPDGQLQDYDHSIHRVVSQLREILRDRSSMSTQFIETLPKRGYRFSVAVEEIPIQEEAVPAQSGEISDEIRPDSLKPAHPVIDELAPGIEIALPSSVPSLPAASAGLPAAVQFGSRQRWTAIIALCLLLVTGGAFLWTRGWPGIANKPLSLGIVPFEAMGPNASPLAESLRLNLADVLSQSPEIETRAVHSFDHGGQDEGQVLSRARQLEVEALLFGKFTVTGDQCQLRLELVRSRDGVHLSSFQYSGNLEEIAAISDRVERDVFERLHPYRKAVNLNLGKPANSQAYAAYLRGRGFLQQWTNESLLQAISSFEEAITEDPAYARAYAGLSSAYFVLSQHRTAGAAQNLQQCRTFATKAVTLDPSLAEAHVMLGQAALNIDWNFPLAEQELQSGISLDPNHAVYHQWLAALYGIEGQHALSLQEIDKARADDPNWAPIYMTEIFLADTASDFDRSNDAAGRLLQMMPGWSLTHEQIAMSLWARGSYAKAVTEWREAAVLEQNPDRVRLEDQGAKALKIGGVPAYARLRLQAIATRKGVSHEEQDFVPAEWHAYAGDWDQALTGLEQMVDQRSPAALQINSNPAYVPLRRTPRYLRLIKRIGLPAFPS